MNGVDDDGGRWHPPSLWLLATRTEDGGRRDGFEWNDGEEESTRLTAVGGVGSGG